MYSSLNDSLWNMVNKLGLAKKLKERMALDLWGEVVGAEVEKYTQAENIRGGILTIKAESSSWCQQLSLLRMNYINQLNFKLGEKIVKEIRFKTGSIKPENKRVVEHEKTVYPLLSESEKKLISEQAAIIQDQELGTAYQYFLQFNKKLEKQRAAEGWSRCPHCGRQIPQEDELCLSCNRKEQKTKEFMVEQLLYEVPWADYSQINRVVSDLEEREFEQIKNGLILKLKEKIAEKIRLKGNSDQINFLASFLFMLINRENPTSINPGEIKQILKIKYSRIS